MHLPQFGAVFVVTSVGDISVSNKSVLLPSVISFSLHVVLGVVTELELVIDVIVSALMVASVSELVWELFIVVASGITEKNSVVGLLVVTENVTLLKSNESVITRLNLFNFSERIKNYLATYIESEFVEELGINDLVVPRVLFQG